MSRWSYPWLKAQEHDSCPWNFKPRLRETIVSLIVSLSCPLNMSLKDTYHFWNFRNFQGHELCCLPEIVSCPWIVSMDMSLSRHNNGARKFRNKNQGHDSGTGHDHVPESCPWTCPWIITIVPESSGTRTRDTIQGHDTIVPLINPCL